MFLRCSFYFFLFFVIGFILPKSSCAQETITITTYYPAPFGVYQTLRLFPSAQPTTCEEGNMYYDSSSHQAMVCAQDSSGNLIWQSLGLWGRSGNTVSLPDSNWNVSVGTATPAVADKLYVNGNIYVTGVVHGGTHGFGGGFSTGDAWYAMSPPQAYLTFPTYTEWCEDPNYLLSPPRCGCPPGHTAYYVGVVCEEAYCSPAWDTQWVCLAM